MEGIDYLVRQAAALGEADCNKSALEIIMVHMNLIIKGKHKKTLIFVCII